jgi:hypothetical protein
VIFLKSGWNILIKLLNDKEKIPRTELLKNKEILNHVKWFTIHDYLDHLNKAGFIRLIYEPIPVEFKRSFSFDWNVKIVLLERKIPESLTIKKAIAMGKKQWLQWFMEEENG